MPPLLSCVYVFLGPFLSRLSRVKVSFPLLSLLQNLEVTEKVVIFAGGEMCHEEKVWQRLKVKFNFKYYSYGICCFDGYFSIFRSACISVDEI